MKLDPAVIRQQIGNLLVSHPELADDDILRADMVEGETEAFNLLSQIVRGIGESNALARSNAEYRAILAEREARFERRCDALRSLAFDIMQSANLRKAELPEATLSVRAVPPKVIITDEAAIGDMLCKFTRAPDKTKIRERLTAGETIIGAELSNGGETISIRIK